MEKKLQVAALCNGTVIDHIPSDKLFSVVSILHLDRCKNQITIGNNLTSNKLGTKGIIKISDRFFAEDEINKIALIAPNAKINIIKNYHIIEKKALELPNEIRDVIHCVNPNCVTNYQPIATRFQVIKEDGQVFFRCHYCEHQIKQVEVQINNTL